MKYSVKKKRNGINNKEMYYAVPSWSGLIGTREIAHELSRRSTLSPADIRATLIGLVDIMEFYLHDGYSIKLDDLGVFRLSVTSEGFENPKDCTPRRVQVAKLCFRADTEIKKKLKSVKFERIKNEK